MLAEFSSQLISKIWDNDIESIINLSKDKDEILKSDAYSHIITVYLNDISLAHIKLFLKLCPSLIELDNIIQYLLYYQKFEYINAFIEEGWIPDKIFVDKCKKKYDKALLLDLDNLTRSLNKEKDLDRCGKILNFLKPSIKL